MTRFLFCLIALLGLSSRCTPARAQPLVELSVVDRDHGQVLPTYPHRGDRWVAGLPGHRYALRLTNLTGERVLVVLSVDGVNAVTGQSAHPLQSGYVLDPWETTEIAGWRKSLDDVAQFVFTDIGDSYAARTGRPNDVGVVGIAVFRERVRYREMPSVARAPREESARADSSANAEPAPAAAAASKSAERQRLGTGHGDREWSPVGSTGFVRATREPSQISEIRYDAPRRLIAMGILPPRYRRDDSPRAFPSGFVADPPAWR